MMRLIIKFIKKYLIKVLGTEKIRNELIEAINKHVDIPMINEEVEEKVYLAIFDVFGKILIKNL
jgi:hypothetical protein